MQTKVPKDIQKAVKKSLWKAKSRRVWEFFCSNCKQARRLAIPRQPFSAAAIMQLVLATAFFVLATWYFFTWKGIIVFVPLAATYELIYRIRVRGMMECPHCGFDPYLYVVDAKVARREIEAFWKRKFDEKGIPLPLKPGEVRKAPPESSTFTDSSDLPKTESNP